MMNSKLIRSIIVALATVSVIAFNAIANMLPLNGLTTGEISDRFNVLFVPAGYVFSIWGLIYLFLIGFSIFQLFPKNQINPKVRSIDILFLVSCLANVGWLFLWHYEQFLLTLFAMFALLMSLIFIYFKLEIGRIAASFTEILFLRVPFSVYLGWISVATIANVSTVLVFFEWKGWGVAPEIWTIIMLMVGTVLVGVMSTFRRDIPYILVFIWAYIGIGIKQAEIELIQKTVFICLAIFTLILMLLVKHHFASFKLKRIA
jgi:translocator protein